MNPVTNPIDSTLAAPVTQTRDERASLNQDDFYKIMIAEMTNQDPLSPSDQQAFLDQLTSLQNLEVTDKLNTGIENLIFQQSLGSASSLIGRQVLAVGENGAPVAQDPDGQPMALRVDKVQIEGGALKLVLENGERVPLENVREIRP